MKITTHQKIKLMNILEEISERHISIEFDLYDTYCYYTIHWKNENKIPYGIDSCLMRNSFKDINKCIDCIIFDLVRLPMNGHYP